jgi:uncharacterized protein Yka (UPF0111/DUF47 family)
MTKNKANETCKQITQNFRNSQPVQEAVQALKDIEDWADQAIKASRNKSGAELVIPREAIAQQNENIRAIINRLQTPPPATQSPPRHQHF